MPTKQYCYELYDLASFRSYSFNYAIIHESFNMSKAIFSCRYGDSDYRI